MEKDLKYTKYEKARIIGARALQISMGAPLLLKMDQKKLEEINYNPVEIAKMEFENQIIPISVKRRYPEVRVTEVKPKIGAEDLALLEPEEPEEKSTKKGKKAEIVEEDEDEEI